MSGLLPPSPWHLGKYRAGRREKEEGEILCLGKTEGGRLDIRRSEEDKET